MAESLSRRAVAMLRSLRFPLSGSFLRAGRGCLTGPRGIALMESDGAALIKQPEKRGIQGRENGRSLRQ